jgi:hypothetical protein
MAAALSKLAAVTPITRSKGKIARPKRSTA